MKKDKKQPEKIEKAGKEIEESKPELKEEPADEIVNEKEPAALEEVPVEIIEKKPLEVKELIATVVEKEEGWEPKTRLGMLVKEGKINSIEEIMVHGPIMEAGIVDALVPGLKEEVIDIAIVQRMHGSGRRVRFRAVVIVGNGNGYLGVGKGRAKEVGPAIRKAITDAKLNIMPIVRACGSWECKCNHKHSVPFKVVGKSGSVKVVLIPAPRGLGLAASESIKRILQLAGIEDVWVQTFGDTRTKVNSSYATVDALKKTLFTKIPPVKAPIVVR